MNELLIAVDNGTIFLICITILVFGVIGIGWLVVYNINVVSTEIESRDFADAFGSIVFVIGLITNTLIMEAKATSTARPRMYDALLYSLTNMARKLSGVRVAVSHQGGGHEWRRNAEGGDSYTHETLPKVNQHIHDMAMYIFVMTRYSFIVFQPADPHRDYLEYVSAEEYNKYEDILSQTVGARFKSESATNIFANAILHIETQLMHMHHNGVIPSGTYTNMSAVLDDISNKVHDITVSMRIATPRIFDQLSYAVLFFYLVILLPLQVYSNVNWWMILVYPIALFIYVSNILFGAWMGDPLMTHPRYAGGEVVAWRHQLYAFIRELLLRDDQKNIYGSVIHRLDTNPTFISTLKDHLERK